MMLVKRWYAYFLIFVFLGSTFLAWPSQVYAQEWEDLSVDFDGDGLPNVVEQDGWYNAQGGPFYTDPLDADSDDDGLSDGREKLYDTHPFNDHSPGIYVEYERDLQTKEYYPWQRFGDNYVALPYPLAPWGEDTVVVRRGATFSVGGPPDGALTISKSIGSLTTLTPVRNPCSGRWDIHVPEDGTVGIYTITVEDGSWDEELNLYVIFQLPTNLSDAFVDAFIYNDDPDDVRDDRAAHYAEDMDKREYDHDDYAWIPEGEWIYHGYAWIFDNAQYKDYVFEDHVIQSINGMDNTWDAANALGQRVDEYTCVEWPQYHSNAWCALNPYHCSGNYRNECTTVATLLASFNRSAGIPSRPIWTDWRHSSWDHSTEVWTKPAGGTEDWYVMRGYASYEGPCYSPQIAEGYVQLRSTSGWYSSGYGLYTVGENWPESEVGGWWSPGNDEYRMATWQFDKSNQVGKIVKKDWWETRFVDYWSWPAEPTVTGTPPDDWPDLSGPTDMTAILSAAPGAGDHRVYIPLLLNNSTPGQAIRLGRVVEDYGVDQDSDGRFDQLAFQIQVDVAQAGNYWFRGRLAGGFSEAIGKTYLEAGHHTVELPFDGMDIYLNKAHGPYLLDGPWVTDAENPAKEDFVNGLDFSQPDYQTSPYRFDDFGVAGATLTNEYSHEAIDTDDDGYADALIVETDLRVEKMGVYTAQGVLFVGQDETPVQASWTGYGPRVALQFDGLKDTTGPYTLAHLFVRNSADQITDGIKEPYTPAEVPELSARPIRLSAPSLVIADPSEMRVTFVITDTGYSDAGVDTDSNGKFDQLLITVDVEVEAGEGGQAYRVEGWLADTNGSLISWASGDSQVLAEGTQTLSLPFDGRLINEHGVDGPFTLVALKALSGTTYTVLDEVDVAYTTFAYDHDAFEGAVAAPATNLFDDDVESWTVEGDSFEAGVLNAAWTTYSSTSEGRIRVTDDYGAARGTYALLMDDDSAGTYTLNEAIWSVDLSGVSEASLTFWHAEWDDEQHGFDGDFSDHYNADGVAISDDGVNWHPIQDAPDQEDGIWKRYTFDLAAEAAAAGMALGPNFRIKFQQYDNYPLSTGPDGRGWDEIVVIAEGAPGGQWTSESPWSIEENEWYSYSHAWEADAPGAQEGPLTIAAPIDAYEYISPTLKFATCYQIPSGSNAGYVEVSPNGLDWTPVLTFTGSTAHWDTELVDLSDFGGTSNLQFRFNADSQTGLLWYVDDVHLAGWPGATASFTYSPQPALVGADTTFVASTSIVTPPITYTWDFDDGPPIQMIDTPTVTHQFSSDGDYTVQLTVENAYDDADYTEVVEVGEPIAATSFDYDPDVPQAGDPINFTITYTPTSATTPVTHTWDFGDGDVVVTTTQTIAHSYDAGGDYTVNLTTTNYYSTAAYDQLVQVKEGVSDVSFTYDPVPAVENVPITFTAHVTPGTATQPITYTWDFGDGSPIVETNEVIVAHTFSSATDYTIQLAAENPYGSAAFSATIGVGTAVVATSFDYSPAAPEVGTVITFTASYTPSSAIPPITYNWNFGGDDGAVVVTTTQTVAHSYDSGGYQTVTLTTTNGGGGAVYARPIEVKQGVESVSFDWIPAAPQEGELVVFTAHVTPSTASRPITYTWYFVDSGTTVTTSHVVEHVFSAPDTYYAWIIADNGYGSSAWYEAYVVVSEDINDPPEAADDSATVDESDGVTTLDGGHTSVLHNDTDPDQADTLTVNTTPVTGPDHGSLTLNGDGTFSYTHDGSETTDDSFTYQVCDDGSPQECDTAMVSITILPINDAPVANDDSAVTDEDTAVVIGVLTNDSDAEDDPLTVEAVGAPAHGQVSTDGTTVTYTPTLNFNGSDTFTYTVGDGSLIATAAVTVTVEPVNDDPVAVDDEAETDEDTPVSIEVLFNDYDVEYDFLTLDSVTQPDHGTADYDAIEGVVIFTPTLDFSGEATFSYNIIDGNGGSDTAQVSVNVIPVNDAPQANDDQADTDEDTAVTVDALANDSDPDDDLSIDAVTQPAHGVVVNNGDDLTYTPQDNYNGADSFTYTVGDGTLTATATVSVTIGPVSDAPAFTSAPLIVATEDVTYSYVIVAEDVDAGDVLTITAPISPAWLSFTDNGAGTAKLEGTPTNADVGDHSVKLLVRDTDGLTDTQAFTITVGNANDAPTDISLSNDSLEENEPAGTTVGILSATDQDSGDSHTYTLVPGPGDADNGFFAAVGDELRTAVSLDYETQITYTIRVSATDTGGLSYAEVFTITVADVNDAPAFTSAPLLVATEGLTYTYSIVTSDDDGDTITITAPCLPSWLTLTNNGDGTAELRGTPGEGSAGEYAVELQAEDTAGAIGAQDFVIAVNAAEPDQFFIYIPVVLRNKK